MKAAHLDTDQALSAGEARRLACNAGLVPAVLGTEGQVLDAERRRIGHFSLDADAVDDQRPLQPALEGVEDQHDRDDQRRARRQVEGIEDQAEPRERVTHRVST